MDGKKISFGFMKTKKTEKPVMQEKKDFIECLEEKSIKIVGGEPVVEEKPLVIPMKPNTLITAERLKEIAEKVESSLIEPEKETTEDQKPAIKLEPIENETLEQMAVRELMQDANKEVKIETQALTVPVPSKPIMDGEKESTLDDYEAVPVQDFGMAMLRGMGWTAGNEQAKYKQPQLRPKGLGLGADKVISDNKKKNASKDNKEEELSIVKNSYVKITTGKYSGYYGMVVSLDEENGRVMVDITVKKETVSLSEFMMQPVTKAEFDKESKVINTDAYQEYKNKERSEIQKSSRTASPQVSDKSRNASPKVKEREASSSYKTNDSNKDSRREPKDERRRDYEKSSNGRSVERSRRDSSSSDDRKSRRKKDKNRRDLSESKERSSRRKKDKYKRDSSSSEDRGSRRRKDKEKKKYGSNESLDSISDTEKKKKHKNNRRYKDSSGSESDSHKKDKRDIDKKRKGKKKKRDRDRSPNYKKHRK